MAKHAVRTGLTCVFRLSRFDINASDSALEKSMEENDKRETWCARALIFGLIVEVAFAIWFRDGVSFIRTWAPVFADILVAGGVWGEVHFAAKISQASVELRRRSTDRLVLATKLAAEANERAEQARLEAERIKLSVAWRSIPNDKLNLLSDELRKCPSSVHVRYVRGDPEAQRLAAQICKAFDQAGWTWKVDAVVPWGAASGLWVLANSPPTVESAVIVSETHRSFAAIGISFGRAGGPAMSANGDQWGPDSPPVKVLVGSKQDPEILPWPL